MAVTLTQNDLLDLFGPAVFERGLGYADGGAVLSVRQEGNVLHGQVMGTHLYQARFQLIPPFECRCTCPYEWGPCKHAAALAIVWLRRGEPSGDKPPRGHLLRNRLGGLSDSELVNLIVGLVDMLPGAWVATEEWLIRRDVAALGRLPDRAGAEAEAVRGMLRSLIAGAPAGPEEEDEEENWEEEWEEDEPAEEVMAPDALVDALIGAVEAHSLPESLPFRVLALAECSVELVTSGEHYGLALRWSRQVERMGRTMAGLITAPGCPAQVAADALSVLLDCFCESRSSLGNLLKPVLVAASAAPGMRSWLLGQVDERGSRAPGPGLIRLHDLAGEVQAAGGNVRAALESFHKAGAPAGRMMVLARQCLQEGDAEAAVQACRMAVAAAGPWEAASVRSQAAAVLLAAADRAGARALLLHNFREAHSWEAAVAVLDTAETPDERRQLAGELGARAGQAGALLVRLHLAAGQAGSALTALRTVRDYRPELHVAVAAAIAPQEIETAVDLWTGAVQHYVAQKNRNAYAEAAKALVQMRTALWETGHRPRWQQYYADLLARHRAYQALKRELAQAGL